MYAEDFVYDGVALSDFNFVIASFDQPDKEVRDTGSKITMNLTSSNYGKTHNLAGSTYDACITCTFQIIKDPDKFGQDEMEVTSDEYRDIVRWLNRREFHRMQFVSYCEDDMKEMPYYNATFNVNKIMIDEVAYGIELTMQTDSPFGYFDPQTKVLTPDNGVPAYGASAAQYIIKTLSNSISDVSESTDTNLMATHPNVSVDVAYGADGNGVNYVGKTTSTTAVPYYTPTSSEVKYAASNVGFTTTMESDDSNLTVTDVTEAPIVEYRERPVVGEPPLTGSITTYTPAYTETKRTEGSNYITERVYSDIINGDITDADTVLCSVSLDYRSYERPNNGDDATINAVYDCYLEIYGEVNGEEYVAASMKADTVTGYWQITHVDSGTSETYYVPVFGLQITKSDILPWRDNGVYGARLRTVRTLGSNQNLYAIGDVRVTKISTNGSDDLTTSKMYQIQTVNMYPSQETKVDWGQISYKSYSSSISWTQWSAVSFQGKFVHAASSTGSISNDQILYSDGRLLYYVYDKTSRGQTSDAGVQNYKTVGITLNSDESATITNVFSSNSDEFGALLVREVSNGTNTYYDTEQLNLNHGSITFRGPTTGGSQPANITATRSYVSAVVNYNDTFFSNYGSDYTRKAYLTYTYDLRSSLHMDTVVSGTPVGNVINGSGGGNYDAQTSILGSTASANSSGVYLDYQTGYIYVSDGALWHKIKEATNLYYVTQKLPINDDESYRLRVDYTKNESGRTLYMFGGVGSAAMEEITSKRKTISSSIDYLFGSIMPDVFEDYTTGQRYIQFKYTSVNMASGGAHIVKVSPTNNAANITIGYNTGLTTSGNVANITDKYVVGISTVYSAPDNTYRMFLNTYNRYLYVSDGRFWYYDRTIADSGNRMSLSVPFDDAMAVSCLGYLSSATTASGHYYFYAGNGENLTTTETTIASNTRARYTVWQDTIAGFIEDAGNSDKYVVYVRSGTTMTSARITCVKLSDSNNGMIEVGNATWETGQSTSINGNAASAYAGGLGLSTSGRLYFSDGYYWFFLMSGVETSNYATTRIALNSGDCLTFSVVFNAERSFRVTKVEYGVYNGKMYYKTTPYDFASATDGTCVSNDDTFTVGTLTIPRSGAYFFFPWESGCRYYVTKVASGASTGVLSGIGGGDYDGKTAVSAGSVTTYDASDNDTVFYIDHNNNKMYVSDGVFWHYLRTTQAGRFATANVPVENGEYIVFKLGYPHAKSLSVSRVITAMCTEASSTKTDTYTYSAADANSFAIMARYDDGDIAKYGPEYDKYVRVVFPYETGMSVVVEKIIPGAAKNVVHGDIDPAYGYNSYDEYSGKTTTVLPGDTGSLPAHSYLYNVYCNDENGNICISDGEYWWYIKNGFDGNTGYLVRKAEIASSSESDGVRTIRVENITDDDTIVLNLSYPEASDFDIVQVRGTDAAVGTSAITTLSYTETDSVTLSVKATDADYRNTTDADGRYVTFSFPDADSDWNVVRISKSSSDSSAVMYGKSGGDFDGMEYVSDEYGQNGETEHYASDYAYQLYMDEANGALYASDGRLWHYVAGSSVQYFEDSFYDHSDEIGYSYPDVVINIQEAGRYVLQSVEFGTSTEINGCLPGEIITMHGATQTIETNMPAHDIAKDFNFEFLRVGNTFNNRMNTLRYRLPATTTIYHTPYVKDLT